MLCQDDRSFNGCNVLLSISLFISTKYDGLIQRTEKWTEFTFSQRAAAPTFKGSEWGLDVTKMFLMEFLRLLTGMLLTLRVSLSLVWHLGLQIWCKTWISLVPVTLDLTWLHHNFALSSTGPLLRNWSTQTSLAQNMLLSHCRWGVFLNVHVALDFVIR